MPAESADSPKLVAAHSRVARHLAERIPAGWRWLLRIVAVSMLTVYVGWNLYWLSQYRLAPSLFQGLTGLPSPTTGGTRSFLALVRGEVRESLLFNAMTVPLCLLLAATVIPLGGQLARKQKVALAPAMVVIWAAILPLAWVLKLLGDPHYW